MSKIVNTMKFLITNISIFTALNVSSNYISNTFIYDSKSNLQSTRETSEINKTAGIVQIGDNVINFYTFDEILEKNLDWLEKKVTAAKSVEKRLSGLKTENLPNRYMGQGSGSCVNYNDQDYILTNYHVAGGVDEDFEEKMFSNVELDVTLIPLSLLNKKSSFSLEDCLKLDKYDISEQESFQFFGLGRDLYKGFGELENSYITMGGFKLDLDIPVMSFKEPTLNPYNQKFVNNFPGTSGSTLFNNNKDVLGVLHAVSSVSNGRDLSSIKEYLLPIFYPINKTFGHITPVNDIVDWLEKDYPKL